MLHVRSEPRLQLQNGTVHRLKSCRTQLLVLSFGKNVSRLPVVAALEDRQDPASADTSQQAAGRLWAFRQMWQGKPKQANKLCAFNRVDTARSRHWGIATT